ncbi:MAG: helical backbone metal receptor [Cytophagaceae bacterium]
MKQTIVLYLSILLFSHCAKNKKHEDYVVDAFSDTLYFENHPLRIISLTPSVTELLFAFTDTSKIIAVSNQCNAPIYVEGKKRVSSYPVDIETIASLKPDLVVVKSDMIEPATLQKLKDLNIPVLALAFNTLNEIQQSSYTLVKATQGDTVAWKQWWEQLNDDYSSKSKLSYVAVITHKPIYVYGEHTFVTELANRYGENLIQNFKSPYPEVSVEYLYKHQPDVWFFSDSTQAVMFFEEYPILAKGRYMVIDDDILSRPGYRLPLLNLLFKSTLRHDG